MRNSRLQLRTADGQEELGQVMHFVVLTDTCLYCMCHYMNYDMAAAITAAYTHLNTTTGLVCTELSLPQ